jgi:D-arabinose 1-dehydrogenase-like Zn-dependent alcohol dehydrogenase
VQIAPFVEMRSLADINAIFESVHRREIVRRVVLQP